MDLNALHNISYGLYIISVKKDGELNGQIASAVFQINSDPIIIEIVINKLNYTHEFLQNSDHFGISILNTETPMKYIGRFGFKSGRSIDKFEGVNYKLTPNGIPIPLDYTIAWLECKKNREIDANTHTMFFGEITDCEVIGKGKPLDYAYYHEVKKGKEPPTAPSFVKGA